MTERAKISLALLFVSVCCTATLLTYYATNRQPSAPHPELYGIICRQLDAFRNADFTQAYGSASSNIQARFSLSDFTEMIRTNYTELARASRVELGPIQVHGDRAFVQIFFIDRRGRVVPCIYSLVNEGDGWKIDGARMLPRWPAGHALPGAQT